VSTVVVIGHVITMMFIINPFNVEIIFTGMDAYYPVTMVTPGSYILMAMGCNALCEFWWSVVDQQ